ncbi:5545_t:CDS:2 [Paraglomus brasilianum]|uniref:Small ribosomal subunit protein mS23 n=1 Tax=Paraglomus brasilianum TaxID=144538 RepID=A0A9N9GDU1_9GLOM|nr:5545_t:CDS:2 [Paraglomus brasilianum]
MPRFFPQPTGKLHSVVAGLLKGKIYKKPPPWYPVMNLIPPGPSLIRGGISFAATPHSLTPTTVSSVPANDSSIIPSKFPSSMVSPDDASATVSSDDTSAAVSSDNASSAVSSDNASSAVSSDYSISSYTCWCVIYLVAAYVSHVATSLPLPTTNTKKGRSHSSKHLRQKHARPQPIVYPEDRLRRIFYRDHPYELLRPQVLIEKDAPRRTIWDSLTHKGEAPSDITGESVIQYQLHLMSNGSSERDAYVVACREFYAVRAREEVEQRVAEEQARAFGAKRVNSETIKAIRKETKVIRKTLKDVVQNTLRLNARRVGV